jgi:metallo-beta-lactamase class B
MAWCTVAIASAAAMSEIAGAQGQSPPDRPAVTVGGQTYTPRSILARNMGTEQDQTTQFPPHKVIGNIYYVGTRTLSAFLITTPQGHILINTTYERNVPVLEKSVADLGFKFADVRIVLGTHAHGDHQEGDAAVKQKTGAQVMAMAEDVPALERMRPGGKPHPIDRVLRDGDRVTLGGSTLVARLTPGHTKGCTTWTTTVQEDGRDLSVVIIGSMGSNPGFQFVNNKDNPTIAAEYQQGFKVLRSLKPDIPLASHPAMYNMTGKIERLGSRPNPFIDPAGYTAELDAVEGLFKQVLTAQQKAAAEGR